MVYATATHMFSSVSTSSGEHPKPIFMDMAYYPRPTPLTQIARALGWTTIDGMESMIEQGLAQQRMWKAGDASVEAGTRPGVLSDEIIRQVRLRLDQVVMARQSSRAADPAHGVVNPIKHA
jgi:quinate dehydrogenase